jgi:hypothetical protein
LHFGSVAGDSANDTPAIASPAVRAALHAANPKQCLALDVPAFLAVHRVAQNFSGTTSSGRNINVAVAANIASISTIMS